MSIREVEPAALAGYSHLWMGPGEIWQRDFSRVLGELEGGACSAFELLDTDSPVAGGWVAEDRFDSDLLGAPARRVQLLVAFPLRDEQLLELGEWLERRLMECRFACLQTWQEIGASLGETLSGFKLVAVDRYFVGTAHTLNLPADPPSPPPGFEVSHTTTSALSGSEKEAIRHIHQTVRWQSRFHADPDCDPEYSRKRASLELTRLLSAPDVPVILGHRGGNVVAYWITPVEYDLDIAARHAQGANLEEGSGIATCIFVRQHSLLLSEASTILHPTQASNRRIARLMEHIRFRVLCHRFNFHRWAP